MNHQMAERYIRNFTGYTGTAAQDEVVRKAAERMVQHGECVWHAVSQVTGKICPCTPCVKLRQQTAEVSSR